MAARRVAPQINENSDIIQPTAPKCPVDTIGDFRGLSNPFGEVNPTSAEAHLPRFRSVALTILRTLNVGTEQAWSDAILLLAVHLSPAECLAIARAAKAASETSVTSPVDRVRVILSEMDEVSLRGTGLVPPLGEARRWAMTATREELKAYALAAFENLNAADQTAFLRHVQPMEATA